MRKIIYTAIMGNYDRLLPIPEEYRRGWEAVCYTDQKHLKRGSWELVQISDPDLLGAGLSKKIKILSHLYAMADVSLWVDASLKVLGPLDEVAGYFAKDRLTLLRHPERNCVYEEMDACIALKKADPAKIELQRAKYRKMGFPENFGLFKAGILARWQTPEVIALNDQWWKETRIYKTWRDQLTLPLALWKLNFTPKVISDYFTRRYFKQMKVHRGK